VSSPTSLSCTKKARWTDPRTKTTIEILIEPRANGRPICSGCGQRAPGYDRLAERRFEFVPLWQIAVFFVYAMRRVECPRCGVKVEQVPWCDGKNQLTTTYRWFLAGWAKRLSWKGVAEAFGTTWQNVFRSVQHAVSWGLAHRSLERIKAIGIDEVQWQKGHLTDKETVKLSELVKYNLRSVRAYLLKEDFQRLWEYERPGWAGKFLDQWCTRTMRSKLEPMKKIARSLRAHRELILNWFEAKGTVSSGIVEGLNNKVKLTTRKSYGFRTYEAIETTLSHNLGALPEP
jgi:transposase